MAAGTPDGRIGDQIANGDAALVHPERLTTGARRAPVVVVPSSARGTKVHVDTLLSPHQGSAPLILAGSFPGAYGALSTAGAAELDGLLLHAMDSDSKDASPTAPPKKQLSATPPYTPEPWSVLAPAFFTPGGFVHLLGALACAYKAGLGAGQIIEALTGSGAAGDAATALSTMFGATFYWQNSRDGAEAYRYMVEDLGKAYRHRSMTRAERREIDSTAILNPGQVTFIASASAAYGLQQAMSIYLGGSYSQPWLRITMSAVLGLANLINNPKNVATFADRTGIIRHHPTAMRYKAKPTIDTQRGKGCAGTTFKIIMFLLPATVNIFGGAGLVLTLDKSKAIPAFTVAGAMFFGMFSALAVPGMCAEGVSALFAEVEKERGWRPFFKKNGLAILLVAVLCGIPSNWLAIQASYVVINLMIALFNPNHPGAQISSLQDYAAGKVADPLAPKNILPLIGFALVLLFGTLAQSLNKGRPFNRTLLLARDLNDRIIYALNNMHCCRSKTGANPLQEALLSSGPGAVVDESAVRVLADGAGVMPLANETTPLRKEPSATIVIGDEPSVGASTVNGSATVSTGSWWDCAGVLGRLFEGGGRRGEGQYSQIDGPEA